MLCRGASAQRGACRLVNAGKHWGLATSHCGVYGTASAQLDALFTPFKLSNPQLLLECGVSLLSLLRKSPPHPRTFEQWRALRKNRLPGAEVCRGVGEEGEKEARDLSDRKDATLAKPCAVDISLILYPRR